MSIRKWIVTVAVALAGVLVATIGIAAGKTGQERAECTTATTLTVVGAPDVAPVVAAAARIADLADLAAAGCVRPVVTARDPAAVADDIARDRADRPDVWIPDSSIWLRRRAVASAGLPASSPSVARSPIVLAVPRAQAGPLGWPRRRLGFGSLLPRDSGGPQPVQLRLPDPGRSAATVGVLLSLPAAVAARHDRRAVLAAALRASSREPAQDPAALARPGLRLGSRQAVPASEQAVWASGNRAVAVYPPGAGVPFDYPYVVFANRHEQRAAAGRLLAVLRGDLGRRLLDAAGFRDSQGRAGPALVRGRGVDPTAPGAGPPPQTAALEAAVRALQSVNLPSRLLAVLDVSGSMASTAGATAAPGVPTRLDLARTVLLSGLGLYPDDTEVGLWTFATELTGRADYREWVPIVPLGRGADGTTGRLRLAQALAGVGVAPRGGTGLYDTALAAVRAVRRNWDPASVNSVVLLTDGRNDDRAGITLPQLLSTLREENEPARPVYLITIAYGPDSDTKALTAMSRATGAEMYSAVDPLRLRTVLLDAIGRRICRPKC